MTYRLPKQPQEDKREVGSRPCLEVNCEKREVEACSNSERGVAKEDNGPDGYKSNYGLSREIEEWKGRVPVEA